MNYDPSSLDDTCNFEVRIPTWVLMFMLISGLCIGCAIVYGLANVAVFIGNALMKV
jgi:hypothetical protein